MNLTKTKEILEQLVRIHNEKNLLDEELKDIKEVVDEELTEVKWNNLNKLAKLKSQQKLGETMLKMSEFSELVESLN